MAKEGAKAYAAALRDCRGLRFCSSVGPVSHSLRTADDLRANAFPAD
jgi:hypothetical protein